MAVLFLTQAAAGGPSFDRYEVILERRPFGVEPPPPVVVPPPPPVVPPGESMVNQVRMSAVVKDDDGTLRVGLVDQKAKKNYLLEVGEFADSIEIVEADYGRERARLRRGIEDYWVSMAIGGSNKFEAAAKTPAVPVPSNTAPVHVSLAITGSVRQAVAKDPLLSYALRKQMRDEARRKKEQQRLAAAKAPPVKEARPAPVTESDTRDETSVAGEPEMTDQEVLRLLQEYQKELIRSGQTPLPIPLTPESDQELVTEGVLPPQSAQ